MDVATEMTEDLWLTSEDPTPLLESITSYHVLGQPYHRAQFPVSRRKLLLFSCACVWEIYDAVPDSLRDLLPFCESLAEGEVTQYRLKRIQRKARRVKERQGEHYGREAALAVESVFSGAPRAVFSVSQASATVAGMYSGIATWASEKKKALARQCRLLRDIVGNPFQPKCVAEAWLTSTVIGLASGIYKSTSFENLPILADALEEAGCYETGILGHLRGPEPHARGCWAVDLLLGQE